MILPDQPSPILCFPRCALPSKSRCECASMCPEPDPECPRGTGLQSSEQRVSHRRSILSGGLLLHIGIHAGRVFGTHVGTVALACSYFATFPRSRAGSPLRAGSSAGGFPAKNDAQRNSRAGSSPVTAILTAISATALTIQSKFSCPTDVISASGAGFRKSIAYGTPPSTANSTVFKSYPSTRHKVSASFSMRSFSAAEDGGGFPFTYRS